MAGWISLSLQRIIADLRPSEVVVTEKIDRISRLTLLEAEQPGGSIRAKGARLAIPGLVNLSDLVADTDGITKIVLKSMQELLLKLALHMAKTTMRRAANARLQLAKSPGKHCGRVPNKTIHLRIIALRSTCQTVQRTAELSNCSLS